MRRAAPILIVLAILATFWVVCTAGFTNWDDALNVTNNPHLKPPTAEGLVFFWLHPYDYLYIPLSYSVWWVLVHFRMAGPNGHGSFLDPQLFHVVNLLLHIGAALIVFRLLLLLTRREWAACAGALLFALHPLQVEPVAWITGLKDVLCGLLSMVALWQYVLFAGMDPNPLAPIGTRTSAHYFTKRQWHYLLAVLAFVAALLAKPSAITVPLLALVIDRLLLHRRWKQIAISVLPLCAIAAASAIVTTCAQPVHVPNIGPLWSRPFVAGDALAFYLSKLVLPIGLSAVYPHSVDKVLASRMLWLAWLVPMAVVVLACALRRRVPWFAAAAFISIAALLPVLGLVPFAYEQDSTVADRYMYVAMLGPSLALAFGLARLEARRSPAALRSVGAICAVSIAVLAAISSVQAKYWHDSRSLFGRVLQVDPNSSVALGNLAADAMDHGNLPEAEKYANRAVEVAPNGIDNRILLGNILLRLGRKDEAARQFVKVYRLQPRNVVALTNLAMDLDRRGHLQNAITICRGAAEIDPQYPEAHRTLAILLSKAHQDREALRQAAEAVRLEPGDPANHSVYGQMLQRSGHIEEAQEQFDEARAINPNATP